MSSLIQDINQLSAAVSTRDSITSKYYDVPGRKELVSLQKYLENSDQEDMYRDAINTINKVNCDKILGHIYNTSPETVPGNNGVTSSYISNTVRNISTGDLVALVSIWKSNMNSTFEFHLEV